MISLETLKAHALKNLDKKFPLGSCEHCLAADLTGEEMAAFGYTEGGQVVDQKFAAFCGAVCSPAHDERDKVIDERYVLTGAQIAAALDRIMSGANPYDAANDAWESRNAAA